MTIENTTEVDEFADIFASLTEKGSTHEENTAPDPANSADVPAGHDADPADETAGDGDSAQPPAPGGDGAAEDGEGQPDDQGDDAAGGDAGDQGVDWQARFNELEARVDQQQPPPAPAAPPPPAEIYSADEKAELDTLQQEWPDLHRLFELMARQVQVDTLNYAFSEVGKVIAPLQESVSTYSTNDHMSAIYDQHADYDAVYKPVMEWIEQQPSFLKAAYQNVVKQGTADEVSTMIQMFKDETKWVGPRSSGKPAVPAQKQTELSEAAKKAARAMGTVGTKRGAAANAQDPNDFDGAWEEATAA